MLFRSGRDRKWIGPRRDAGRDRHSDRQGVVGGAGLNRGRESGLCELHRRGRFEVKALDGSPCRDSLRNPHRLHAGDDRRHQHGKRARAGRRAVGVGHRHRAGRGARRDRDDERPTAAGHHGGRDSIELHLIARRRGREAEGDRVAYRWTICGTHQVGFMGATGAGQQVTVSGMTFFRIANGQIVETWDIGDLLALRQQLGLIPSDKANE